LRTLFCLGDPSPEVGAAHFRQARLPTLLAASLFPTTAFEFHVNLHPAGICCTRITMN
jgi:hypothetical protein